jgi:hypothetical protein
VARESPLRSPPRPRRYSDRFCRHVWGRIWGSCVMARWQGGPSHGSGFAIPVASNERERHWACVATVYLLPLFTMPSRRSWSRSRSRNRSESPKRRVDLPKEASPISDSEFDYFQKSNEFRLVKGDTGAAGREHRGHMHRKSIAVVVKR